MTWGSVKQLHGLELGLAVLHKSQPMQASCTVPTIHVSFFTCTLHPLVTTGAFHSDLSNSNIDPAILLGSLLLGSGAGVLQISTDREQSV